MILISKETFDDEHSKRDPDGFGKFAAYIQYIIRNFCHLCQKAFYGSYHLKRHFNTHHREVQELFTCNICHRGFGLKHHLKRHVLKLHAPIFYPKNLTSSKGSVCPYCSKFFCKVSMLERHITAHHKGTRLMYTCDICHRRYTLKSHLKRHFNTHHREILELFTCSLCHRGFTQKPSLKRHIHTVEAFGNVFLQLKRTNRYGAKNVCQYCNKTFYDYRNLRRHFKTQHNEVMELHTCFICSRGFSQRSNLKRHILTVHNITI
ncbi:hypothetical protein LAZ67_1001187 [Cordylochernes scorpioides]|uniref:C2H2-type domain-containing protein n=1 Tax=Cordylochernes scorpioides TaxID=51811 RepID=A0ABY6JWQ0_9ARAC|nr:hypothetical protein LAZ67_1001187 [Cordylochernes scorpioides]